MRKLRIGTLGLIVEKDKLNLLGFGVWVL